MPPDFTNRHEEGNRIDTMEQDKQDCPHSDNSSKNQGGKARTESSAASSPRSTQQFAHTQEQLSKLSIDTTTAPNSDEESEHSPLDPPPLPTPPHSLLPPPPSVIPEESTPIISNRGVLDSPWVVPLQLPAAAAPEPRFSSLHEPPITCTWPQQRQHQSTVASSSSTTAAVPPEISIPVVPASSALTSSSSSSNDAVIWLSAVTDGGAWIRLMWHLLRAVSAGTVWVGPPRTTSSSSSGTSNQLRHLLLPPPSTSTAAAAAGDGTIQGLPAFGQTCFLNATMQSLASLDAFCVYLQHVVYLVELNHHSSSSSPAAWTSSTQAKSNAAASSDKVSRLLLNCLQSVNGTIPSHSFIETRPLLREIGLRHTQFRTMGSEQQDAQEFLTALLDSVVSEGEITSSTFVYPNSFVGLPEPVSSLSLLWEEEEDDVLTVVSGCKERQRLSNQSAETSDNSHPNGVTDRININKNATSVREKNPHPSATTLSGFSSSGQTPPTSNQSTNESHSTTSLEEARSRRLHNGIYVRPEEKKQEDFELHIPKVASEEELMACCRPPPVNHVVDPLHTMMDDPSFSTMSSKERPTLPTSLEIMRTTTTPLTPSPLTGWMGSSLQCRRCGHVRPIRNAPFGDWSVTPTAIADGWLQMGDKNHATRPCRLEDCLGEYVRVERVDDVECRACTLRHEREKMLEEIEMTQGVIAGLLAKARRRGTLSQVACDEHCMALKQELYTYRCELARLDGLDADDDAQPIFAAPEDDNSTSPPLQRASARKCMFLTRLPAILCIHIQRRFYNPVMDRMTKVEQTVIFPEILDVAPYCAYGGVLGGNWAGSSSRRGNVPRDAKPIPYRLQAVMEHRGGAFSGHYVCFRRDKVNGGWLFISDDTVKPVSWAQVQRSQAYMLFYEAM